MTIQEIKAQYSIKLKNDLKLQCILSISKIDHQYLNLKLKNQLISILESLLLITTYMRKIQPHNRIQWLNLLINHLSSHLEEIRLQFISEIKALNLWLLLVNPPLSKSISTKSKYRKLDFYGRKLKDHERR